MFIPPPMALYCHTLLAFSNTQRHVKLGYMYTFVPSLAYAEQEYYVTMFGGYPADSYRST